ncbi:recombinase zinc beta ribbon domain-containing protein [Hominiventricola filiformis]|uniref:recombinase zinc beta ribbon domain-containing protein n=1 Tax=Hominiventricola filiformis TaxID=2885352 RepID=UPI002FE6DF1F
MCGDCNKVFARKGWRSSTGVDRKVWQCSERYKVKGVMGCTNRHVEEETLIKAYLMAWNALVENREDFMEQWTAQQAEREPIRRLSGREVHRIHRWSRNSDRDGHGLHAENTGPHQGF